MVLGMSRVWRRAPAAATLVPATAARTIFEHVVVRHADRQVLAFPRFALMSGALA